MSNLRWRLARVIAFALYYSGGLWLFERIDRGSRPDARCMVIYYHRIASESVGYRDVQVAPDTFQEHVDYMKRRGYEFLSLKQYEEYLSGARQLSRDSIVVTFDDGYRDNYTAAFPLLRESGIPAAVFLCVGPMDGGPAPWWDRIAHAVRSLRSLGPEALADDPPLPADVRALLERALAGDDRQASAAIGRLVDCAKQFGAREREDVLAALESISGSPPQGEDIMLTWEMVREMERGNVSFGAHSITHPILSQLEPEETLAELAGSKRLIEDRLGHEVTSFAYPYGKEGYFSSGTATQVREAGFRWAYTTENGYNRPHAEPYTLRRDGIRDIPTYMLAARLAGFYEHPFFARLRRVIERGAAAPRIEGDREFRESHDALEP